MSVITVEVYDLVKKKKEQGTLSEVFKRYKEMLKDHNAIITHNKIIFVPKELDKGCDVHQALKLLKTIPEARAYIEAILEKLEKIQELIEELENELEWWT